MADDPVLTTERAHMDLARRCLAEMQLSAEGIFDAASDELTSYALGKVRAERLAHLTADPDAPPFFGRVDLSPRSADSAPRSREDPEDVKAGQPEVLHIGRRHVRDSNHEPIVIDWRAPISRGFYRATPTDRMGIGLRRRFGFDGTGELSSYEDEHLDLGERLGLASEILREEIERPRVGPMRDIVATIQPDQDELVRADLDASLAVQGAPGTGKTAVGLHRAAYLLYTYPERLRRAGVVVVGPNAAFLHYIAQVLPALGEGGIEQTTVANLVGHVPVRAVEPAEVAVLKGDARLADVLRRAVLTHVAKPADDVLAVIGTKRHRVPAYRLRRYVDDARREVAQGTLRWNAARDRLRLQLAEDIRRQREAAGGAPSDAETQKLARSKPIRAFVDAGWAALDAAALLARLYTDAALLRRASAHSLTDAERALLAWPGAPRSVRAARWTAADAVLIDELVGILDGVSSYVHIVVDEAQDLSAMQCRAVARRAPVGSVTVLGDLAQATTPWALGDWAETMTHLGHPEATITPLTVGYRVPDEVIAVANRLLPHIAPAVEPARSVRAGDRALRFSAGPVVATVGESLQFEGSVGVIVPDARVKAVLAALTEAGIEAHDLADEADSRVTVVPATAAKGLEFDSVVVLEPARIVAAEPDRLSGLRRLYVVLTRAVSRLTVVHTDPLPVEMT
jgi:DNA helicase IV